MALRSKTLRKMSPVARKMARLIGEQKSIARRWENLLPEIQELEAARDALKTATQQYQYPQTREPIFAEE